MCVIELLKIQNGSFTGIHYSMSSETVSNSILNDSKRRTLFDIPISFAWSWKSMKHKNSCKLRMISTFCFKFKIHHFAYLKRDLNRQKVESIFFFLLFTKKIIFVVYSKKNIHWNSVFSLPVFWQNTLFSIPSSKY